MRHIEIDEDVFKYLQEHAPAYTETPNDTLRRLLGLNKGKTLAARPVAPNAISFRLKRPKTRLSQLTKSGILNEGQKLILHDHKGNPVPGVEAHIRGDKLLCNGVIDSMSSLAKKYMREKCNYKSPEFQGPALWFTESNESVFDLWKKYLEENGSE